MQLKKSIKKLYIVDTNVLLSDPYAIFKLGEGNDVFLPSMVLEELDRSKKGLDEVSRNARKANRLLDEIISNGNPVKGNVYEQCYKLLGNNVTGVLGNIIFEPIEEEFLTRTAQPTGDNSILLSILAIKKIISNDSCNANPYVDVVLISKDINIRVKAMAMNITSQDYLSDQVQLEDGRLPTGIHDFKGVEIEDTGYSVGENGERIHVFSYVDGFDEKVVHPNEFIIVAEKPYRVVSQDIENNTVTAFEVENYKTKYNAWGIKAKNDEQNLAMNLLMDPDIHLVNLMGPAGTGKTLLSVAAALELCIEEGLYNEVIFTRATVGASEEIGFLPGNEEEKLLPWMGGLLDSLEVLSLDLSNEEQKQVTNRFKMKSINFMRGRSFQKKFIIIDEFQNLTHKEARLMLTRAGEGTKIIIMGNLNQIDTAYLTEHSSGLAHVAENLKDWYKGGHLMLVDTIRSELSEVAEQRL